MENMTEEEEVAWKKVKLIEKEFEIKLTKYKIDIRFDNNKAVNWSYWDITVWDELGDNFVGEFCIFKRDKEEYSYNLPLVNTFMRSVDIEFWY